MSLRAPLFTAIPIQFIKKLPLISVKCTLSSQSFCVRRRLCSSFIISIQFSSYKKNIEPALKFHSKREWNSYRWIVVCCFITFHTCFFYFAPFSMCSCCWRWCLCCFCGEVILWNFFTVIWMGGKHLNLTRLLNSIILHPRLRWYWCVSDCNNLTSFFAFSCGAKHSHWVFLRHWRVFVSLLRIHPVDEVQRTSKRQGDRETESISKKKVLWASLFAAGRKYSKFCYVWVGVCLFYHQTKRKYLVHMWKKDCVNAWKRSHSISATVCARQCSFRFDFTGAAVVDGISFSTIFSLPTHTHILSNALDSAAQHDSWAIFVQCPVCAL